MSTQESNWKYTDDVVDESEAIRSARAQSLELGVTPVTPGTGAQLALIAAASAARNIMEIGTGCGVSGLWMLSAQPRSVLTTIDSESEHLGAARSAFTDAGIGSARTRLITGRTHEVLPRMNEDSYDLVLVDADPGEVIENVEHALRLARVGGTVLIPRALHKGKVADPVQRDDVTSAFRSVIEEVATSDAVVSAISPVGDGLLQLTKLG
ncbi:O-methyltransferase [Paramicrobacterium agarici]|uniref:Putative O-methyltransferase YrrM n=1 Tax=Paramicrobacterium agarici TaxID=630514 RepID=A0A2A9DZA8_9MICO|nr:class I SAM-dependent methyltransferase [Microbacterium agarici]PFG31661.1 putative O-methyltransferase YrrM [Microbacterium agarici]TQO21565.1 putative O-methyltransferase YrrM [Microbacterium agarici]